MIVTVDRRSQTTCVQYTVGVPGVPSPNTAECLQAGLDRAKREFGPGHYQAVTRKVGGVPPSLVLGQDDDRQRDLRALLNATAVTTPQRQAGPAPDKICDACNRQGHTVRHCVWVDPTGDFHACPFCEVYWDHMPEQCPKRNEFDDVNKLFELFLVNRGGKTQYRTMEAAYMWPTLLRSRRQGDPTLEELLYPWTPDFALKRLAERPNFGIRHDYTMEPGVLTPDPCTAVVEYAVTDSVFYLCYPDRV